MCETSMSVIAASSEDLVMVCAAMWQRLGQGDLSTNLVVLANHLSFLGLDSPSVEWV